MFDWRNAMFLVLGLGVGLFLAGIKVVKFSSEMDPANLFNGFAILAVGFMIDYQYRRQQEFKRADTDLLLDDVRAAKSALRSLKEAFEPCTQCTGVKELEPAERNNLVSAKRGLSNAVRALEQGLTHCGIDMPKLGFHDLKRTCGELSEIITYDPFPGPYEDRHLQKIRRALSSFESELNLIPYKISRR